MLLILLIELVRDPRPWIYRYISIGCAIPSKWKLNVTFEKFEGLFPGYLSSISFHFVLIYHFWCKMFQICLIYPRNSSRNSVVIFLIAAPLRYTLWATKCWPSCLETDFFQTACWLYFFVKSVFFRFCYHFIRGWMCG